MNSVLSDKSNQRIYDYLFLLVLGAFFGLKFQDLFLPYFWDELGVYSRSAYYLAEHGLSLLPSSVPPELSRGHPLLFSFVYGIFYKLLGKEVWVGHIVSLLISISLLSVLYYYLSKYSGKLIAFCSVLLLVAQPVFFAQSTLVLPEMLLGLLVFLSLIFYYEQRFFWFAVCSTLAILVKESAIVLPVVVLLYGFVVQVILKRRSGFFAWKPLLYCCTSLLVFAGFLQIQKIQNGWYFFPLHIDSLSFDKERFLEFNKGFRDFLLYHQGRYWWVKVLIVSGVFLLVKRKLDYRDHYSWLFIFFILVFVVFSSLNFYMDRYMLSVIPLLVIVVILAVQNIYNKSWFILLVALLLSLLSARDMNPKGFHYDTDMSFRNHLRIQEETIEYLCGSVTKQDAVLANFPLNVALYEKNTGFKLCQELDYHAELRDNTKFVILTSHAAEVSFPRDKYHHVKRIERNGVTSDIYEFWN